MKRINDISMEPGSYRDANGRIFYFRDGIYRGLSEKSFDDWKKLSSTNLFSRSVEEGKIVGTELVDPKNSSIPGEFVRNWAAILKHQTIPFISYPYEWSFNMLKDAALLHIELLTGALDEEMILKDSSSFNVQWLGTSPIFIDITSFAKLSPGEAWVGYRQFCQLFLYPLLLQSYKDVNYHPWLRGDIDGIAPVQMLNLMSIRDFFRPGILAHVFLLAKMQKTYGDSNMDVRTELRNAGFGKDLIKNNVKRIQKLVRNLEWKCSKSEWSHYMNAHGYSELDISWKVGFVRDVLRTRNWRLVWDIGCNTGSISKIAAKNAEFVVAMDSDHLAVDMLYRSLKEERIENLLPLVMNIVDSSPSLGWRGKERKTLSGRGNPDLIICFALIHHIVIGANIPLREFVQWLADFHASILIEFVTKDDPMVRKLLWNKEDQCHDYDVTHFEKYLKEHFIIRCQKVLESKTRTLYFAERN